MCNKHCSWNIRYSRCKGKTSDRVWKPTVWNGAAIPSRQEFRKIRLFSSKLYWFREVVIVIYWWLFYAAHLSCLGGGQHLYSISMSVFMCKMLSGLPVQIFTIFTETCTVDVDLDDQNQDLLLQFGIPPSCYYSVKYERKAFMQMYICTPRVFKVFMEMAYLAVNSHSGWCPSYFNTHAYIKDGLLQIYMYYALLLDKKKQQKHGAISEHSIHKSNKSSSTKNLMPWHLLRHTILCFMKSLESKIAHKGKHFWWEFDEAWTYKSL